MMAESTLTCMQWKQVVDPKVIETTSTTAFPITNATIDENIWNADSDVMKNKFDVYNTVVHWRKSLFLLPSGSSLKKWQDLETVGHSDQNKTPCNESSNDFANFTALKNILYIKIERQRTNIKKKT